METKEKNFENDIESYLLSHGYVKGNQDTYDKGKAIDMPGYGRSMDEDEGYKKIYLQELPKCDIILLVVQADTRDLTDDQIMIENLYEWSKEGRI